MSENISSAAFDQWLRDAKNLVVERFKLPLTRVEKAALCYPGEQYDQAFDAGMDTTWLAKKLAILFGYDGEFWEDDEIDPEMLVIDVSISVEGAGEDTEEDDELFGVAPKALPHEFMSEDRHSYIRWHEDMQNMIAANRLGLEEGDETKTARKYEQDMWRRSYAFLLEVSNEVFERRDRMEQLVSAAKAVLGDAKERDEDMGQASWPALAAALKAIEDATIEEVEVAA